MHPIPDLQIHAVYHGVNGAGTARRWPDTCDNRAKMLTVDRQPLRLTFRCSCSSPKAPHFLSGVQSTVETSICGDLPAGRAWGFPELEPGANTRPSTEELQTAGDGGPAAACWALRWGCRQGLGKAEEAE